MDEKATQLHAIASLKVLLDATKPHNGAASTSAANHVAGTLETQLAQSEPNGIAMTAQIDPCLVSTKLSIIISNLPDLICLEIVFEFEILGGNTLPLPRGDTKEHEARILG